MSGSSAHTVHEGRTTTGTPIKSNFCKPRSLYLHLEPTQSRNAVFPESSILSRVFPFFPTGDVSVGELGADNAAHRSRDEWQLRGVRRGALPLRPLLCYLWDRHRNWTGTGRVGRYELSVSFMVSCWFYESLRDLRKHNAHLA